MTESSPVVTLNAPKTSCARLQGNARSSRRAAQGRVVFGADDAKGGGVRHGARVFDQPTCHWKPEVQSGVLAEESAALLKGFFKARRK
jgi:hypothetical protein